MLCRRVAAQRDSVQASGWKFVAVGSWLNRSYKIRIEVTEAGSQDKLSGAAEVDVSLTRADREATPCISRMKRLAQEVLTAP